MIDEAIDEREKYLAFHTSEIVKNSLETLAKERGQSISMCIHRVIIEYLQENEKIITNDRI